MRDWMILPRFGELRQSHTPGRCVKCGTSDQKRRVLGSGIVLSEGVAPALRGEIQFCEECVKAAARKVDMVDAAQADDYKKSAATANLAKGNLEKRIAKLEAALESLKALADD